MVTPAQTTDETDTRQILLVTGLSGAGKSSILRLLEDLGHEVIDNPPLGMLDEIVARGDRPIAVGVDSRTRGFEEASVLEALARLKMNPHLKAELLYATADEATLLRRYTATRRRHPLAPHGSVKEGIDAETALTRTLRTNADMVIDTSDLSAPELRRLIETRFGTWHNGPDEGLTVVLMSFAFPAGLPREADMVFDARFLRNPYYEAELAPRTGLDRSVADYVEGDPDYRPFLTQILDMLHLVVPRFVQEGKKYATIAVGCSGGRHRSVTLVEDLSRRLADPGNGMAGEGPIAVMHRELARQGKAGPDAAAWRWARRPADEHGGTVAGLEQRLKEVAQEPSAVAEAPRHLARGSV